LSSFMGEDKHAAVWWQALNEPRMPLGGNSARYGQRDIYATVLPQCGGTRDTVPADVNRFFRSQRSGTCSWKVLLTVAREELPLRQYQALKFELQASAL